MCAEGRNEMLKTMMIAVAAAVTLSAGVAYASEPIEGTWLRPSTKTLVKFAPCGGGYCGTVMSGEHKGKSIGKMSGSGGSYKGSITDLGAKKTYTGKASVSGNSMKLSGCVLGGLVCKGENWSRQ